MAAHGIESHQIQLTAFKQMYSNEFVYELEAVNLLNEWLVSRTKCRSLEETRRNGRIAEGIAQNWRKSGGVLESRLNCEKLTKMSESE